MKNRLRILLASIVFLSVSTAAFAAWTINMPTSEEDFYPFVDIETAGDAPAKIQIVIKLVMNETAVGGSHQMGSGEEGTWSYTFENPASGWPVSESWAVKIYDYPVGQDEDEKDIQGFNIISEPE